MLMQDKFSFAGVAAAGVGAGVGYQAGEWLSKGEGFFSHGIGREVASTGAQMLASAATRSAIEGSNFGDNIMAALPDAIGSVVGNALGRAGAKALAKSGAHTTEASTPKPATTTGQQAAAVIASLPTDLGIDLTLPDLGDVALAGFQTSSSENEIVVEAPPRRGVPSGESATWFGRSFSAGEASNEIATLRSDRVMTPMPAGAQQALAQAIRANPRIKGGDLAVIAQQITDKFLPGAQGADGTAWETWLNDGFRKTGKIGGWSYESEPSFLSQLAGELVSTPVGTALLNELNEGSFGIVGKLDSEGKIEAANRRNPNAAAAGAIIGMVAGGGLDAGAHAAESATARAMRLGREGERAAGITGKKVGVVINGRTRFPDQITTTTIKEVKNVARQGWTRQLRDYADLARSEGMTFELWVRQNTRLSRNLRSAEIRGDVIIHRELPRL